MGLVIHHKERYEPIWHGILKIAGIVGCAGIVIFGGVYGLVTVGNRVEQRQQDNKVQAMEDGNTGREVILLDQKGNFMGYKMTYDGHDYLKASTSGGMVHSESCQCKTHAEK